MTQKDVDKILQTYMPEKLWVSRVGNVVYSTRDEAVRYDV